MRRRLFAVLVGCLSALAISGAVFADTVPGPGNFRDSGSSVYLYAFSSECGPSMCTDTNVYGYVTNLRGGDTITTVCVDQYSYQTRGGGGSGNFLSGCAEDGTVNIAADLSSGSVAATVLAQECGRHSCSAEVELSVSAELTAFSGPNAYTYTQKQQYENCTDTYRVKGQSTDAEGTMVVDGTELYAGGQIGEETFAFSSRCR
jgi:hypothetical protein